MIRKIIFVRFSAKQDKEIFIFDWYICVGIIGFTKMQYDDIHIQIFSWLNSL